MQAILNHDSPIEQRGLFSEKTGLKMVDKELMPNFRLNSTQKDNISSSFNQLFQGKIRQSDNSMPTLVDDVVFLKKRQRSQNPNQIEGLKTFNPKDSMNHVLRDDNVFLGNMAEQYKNRVKRKASQAQPTSRAVETIGEILTQKSKYN